MSKHGQFYGPHRGVHGLGRISNLYPRQPPSVTLLSRLACFRAIKSARGVPIKHKSCITFIFFSFALKAIFLQRDLCKCAHQR